MSIAEKAAYYGIRLVDHLLRTSENGLAADASSGQLYYLYQHATEPGNWQDTLRVAGEAEELRLMQESNGFASESELS